MFPSLGGQASRLPWEGGGSTGDSSAHPVPSPVVVVSQWELFPASVGSRCGQGPDLNMFCLKHSEYGYKKGVIRAEGPPRGGAVLL